MTLILILLLCLTVKAVNHQPFSEAYITHLTNESNFENVLLAQGKEYTVVEFFAVTLNLL